MRAVFAVAVAACVCECVCVNSEDYLPFLFPEYSDY